MHSENSELVAKMIAGSMIDLSLTAHGDGKTIWGDRGGKYRT